MKSFRIVIHLNVFYNFSFGFFECEITHLTFECFPKAFFRLVIAWRSGPGHTFSEFVLFNKLLCFLCCILTSPVAVVYSSVGYVRISAYRHFERILHDFLPLVLCYIPADQSPCCHIYYSANIYALAVTFQLCYV